MNNLHFKICTPLLINLIVFNHSYADSTCYIKMRSLNLSVKTETKKICEPKKLKPATTKTNTSNQKLEKSIVEMENYFVYPYTENKEKEKETAADGIGVGVSVGF